jgi:PAS domain S-box-containing protein
MNKALSHIKNESLVRVPLCLSNLQWHHIFNSSNDSLFLLDDSYNITDSNPKAEAIYGYSKEEFQRLNLNNLRAQYTCDEIERAMNKSLDEHGIVFETRHHKKDGSEFPVEISTTPLTVSGELVYIYSVRDITKRKSIEEALYLKEERFRELVDHYPVATLIQSANVIVYINPAGVHLLGAKGNDQLIGREFLDFIHPNYHQIAVFMTSKLNEGLEVPLVEEKIVRLDNSEIDVEVIAKPIKRADTMAIGIFINDITLRKRSMDLLMKF